jgi:hypothetical protein
MSMKEGSNGARDAGKEIPRDVMRNDQWDTTQGNATERSETEKCLRDGTSKSR